jgi:ankyrin repeat protein
VVRLLIEAGADPDAPAAGSWHSETPLRWAASSDDVDVADALTDGGADMEAQGASIGGRDAIGRRGRARLLARGPAAGGAGRPGRQAVARGSAGHAGRVEELLAADPAPAPDAVNDAFWQACHGGQRRVAE